jgi:hypothetical protein
MRTNSIGLLSLLVGLAGSGCGGPLLFAELEEELICKTIPDVIFDPSVPGVDLRRDFPIPLKDYLPLFSLEGASTNIELVELVFNAKSGITDFNSVEQATVTVVGPEGTTIPPAVPGQYVKDLVNLPGRTLVLPGQPGIDLVPFMDTESTLNLQNVMTGSLPPNPWTADVRGCLRMKARLDYGTRIGL